MNHRRAALDRVIVFLVGLVLLAGGAAVVAWRLGVGFVHTAVDSVDVPRVASWPTDSWWPWAVGGAAAVAALLALWLLALNLSPLRVGRMPLDRGGHHRGRRGDGSEDFDSGEQVEGSLSVDLDAVAGASAQVLDDVPGVRRVTHRVRRRIDVPTVELLAHTSARAELEPLRDAALANARSVDEALPETGVVQRVFVLVDPVGSNH